MLDYVALIVIFLLLVLLTAVIVILGSLPGKIAVKRGHPWPDAVNAAGWIGLATGVLWPIAFVWAFLPLPQEARTADASNDMGDLRARVTALESSLKDLQARVNKGTK